MYQKAILPNGLRIVTSGMPHTRSITLAIFIGTGSRYEREEEAGLSHFLEHLLFKGTQRRPTARDISETIERVGGIINGGTDKEITVYSCKVAKPHFPLALDLLVDMLQHSRFDPEEIEKERRVIIEEIHMIYDDPRDWVDVLIDEVLWPGQALGRDVAGREETVNALTREMALGYMRSHYSPRNTVVSIAGDLQHQEMVERVAEALADWQPQEPPACPPARDGQTSPQLRVAERPTEQAHLCLAVRGLSSRHPDRFTLDLLNVVLGEGMSSRLFLEIREKRGLAYEVHSQVGHLLDTGTAAVYAGVDPRRAQATIEAILEQFLLLREQEVPAEELTKAREFTKGRLLLRMEDSRSVAGWMGAQELLTDQILTVDQVVEILEGITAHDLRRVAQEIYLPQHLNLAVVGPFQSEKDFAGLLTL